MPGAVGLPAVGDFTGPVQPRLHGSLMQTSGFFPPCRRTSGDQSRKSVRRS
jgi:hypothetical protein